jgi:hypothetical protein
MGAVQIAIEEPLVTAMWSVSGHFVIYERGYLSRCCKQKNVETRSRYNSLECYRCVRFDLDLVCSNERSLKKRSDSGIYDQARPEVLGTNRGFRSQPWESSDLIDRLHTEIVIKACQTLLRQP